MQVVNPRRWLDPSGEPRLADRRVRGKLLRVARLIEYGGPLKVGAFRETLVECTRRPGRKACLGLLWVVKTEKEEILAYCPGCETDHILIHSWTGTPWAEGPMDPASPRVLVDDEREWTDSGPQAGRLPPRTPV